MSIELLLNHNGHQHSILVGKKCAYCMDCGQILIEYKDKKHFYRLMNPFTDQESIEDEFDRS